VPKTKTKLLLLLLLLLLIIIIIHIYILNRRLGGPQSRSGRFEEEIVCLLSKLSKPRNHPTIPCLESYDDFPDTLGHRQVTTLTQLTSGTAYVFMSGLQENCAFLTHTCRNKYTITMENKKILKGEFNIQYETAEVNGVSGRDTV